MDIKEIREQIAKTIQVKVSLLFAGEDINDLEKFWTMPLGTFGKVVADSILSTPIGTQPCPECGGSKEIWHHVTVTPGLSNTWSEPCTKCKDGSVPITIQDAIEYWLRGHSGNYHDVKEFYKE